MRSKYFKLCTTEIFGGFQIIVNYKDNQLDLVLECLEMVEAHLTAAVVSNDVVFQNKVLAHTVNGTTYCGIRARTTGTVPYRTYPFSHFCNFWSLLLLFYLTFFLFFSLSPTHLHPHHPSPHFTTCLPASFSPLPPPSIPLTLSLSLTIFFSLTLPPSLPSSFFFPSLPLCPPYPSPPFPVGAPQNHWFGPAGDPRAAGIGTPEAIKMVRNRPKLLLI